MDRIRNLACSLLVIAITAASAAANDKPETLSVKPEEASSQEAAPSAKTKREPIYVEEANGEELIAAALKRAQRDDKHVLIEWGGNWCGWCYRLHDVFTKNEDVRPIVSEEFELVLIDSGKNRDLMQHYGGEDRQFSYPHLTILDAEGNVLTNQNTEPLEDGPKHDPQVVAEFLKKWTPAVRDAEVVLAEGLAQAAAQDKRVLVHVGTPYCGWCKVLSQFLIDHAEQLGDDYVDLKIDTLRMENGKAVAERLQPGDSLGVPWMVILDAKGEVLADSMGPDGNCGYPVSPSEVDHFVSMLRESAQRMSDDSLAAIQQDLESFRKERERHQQEQAEAAASASQE